MHPPPLVVCERHGDWGAALRRALGESPGRIVETRSLVDCAAEIGEAGMAAVELIPSDRTETLALIFDLGLRGIPVVALGSPEDYAWEPVIREAGAVHIVFNRRQAGEVARMYGRYVATIPTPPRTIREEIWDRLPWQE